MNKARDRYGRLRGLGLKPLGGILNLRVDDRVKEVDVLDAQPTCLGQAEPGERAKQHGQTQAVGKQLVKLPGLFGSGDIDPLLPQAR